MPNPTTLSATVILAGGESSRMGKPKALLSLPNLSLPSSETLLDFHITRAKMLGVPVLLADNGKNLGRGRKVHAVTDYLPHDNNGKGAGPLSALCGAMLHVSDGYLLVASCDSLILLDQLWVYLQDCAKTEAIYLKNGKDYPLLGLYHSSILAKLQRYLNYEERSVMKFLGNLTVSTVTAPNDWQGLLNFNTKDEFNLALTIFNQRKRRLL